MCNKGVVKQILAGRIQVRGLEMKLFFTVAVPLSAPCETGQVTGLTPGLPPENRT